MVCRLFQYHTHGTEMLDELDEKMIYYFGDMEMNSGNKHEFLGMNITMNKDKSISIEMRDQIQKAIDKFEEDSGILIDDTVSTPET